MKNILIKLFVFLIPTLLSESLIAQNDSIEIYHTEKNYSYPKYEDKDLIKAKTELFLTTLKRAGYIINKNTIKDYEIDIDISTKLKDNNLITFNVVYLFFDSFYSVDLWTPKAYDTKNKKWIFFSKKIESHKPIVDNIENIVFKIYENEINSNF